MKIIKFLIIISFSLFILACSSGGGDSGASSVSAPSDLTGKVYKMTISSGSGFFANQGTYTLIISNTQNIYTTQGDGVYTAGSSGTYTYTANGNQGLAAIIDSSFGSGAFSFTFNTTTSGSFQVTAASDPTSKQSGTFTE